MKLPKQMPSWWPEPGYRWLLNPAGVMRETLILAHPNHPPVMWTKNKAGEWVNMRELTI